MKEKNLCTRETCILFAESENRQRHTPGEEYWHPEQGGVQQRGDES